MIVLTNSVIELADRHTTLCCLEPQPAAPTGFPLAPADRYRALHAMLAEPRKVTYADVAAGKSSMLFNQVLPDYVGNKYWSYYTGRDDDSQYPGRAWDDLLPLRVSLGVCIRCQLPAATPYTVSLVPAALVYPFGWSTWLSLRLTGDHTLEDLRQCLTWLTAEKVFTIDADPQPLSLQQLFAYVAGPMRSDIFAGAATADTAGETIVVTTVLAKHGGSMALGALLPADQALLLDLVRPNARPARRPFSSYVVPLQSAAPDIMDYLIVDDDTRFIWFERLLKPVDRNFDQLRCYHANTFRSLLAQAHQLALLNAFTDTRKPGDVLTDVATLADGRLDALQHYRSASTVAFMQRPDVAATKQQVASRLHPSSHDQN